MARKQFLALVLAIGGFAAQAIVPGAVSADVGDGLLGGLGQTVNQLTTDVTETVDQTLEDVTNPLNQQAPDSTESGQPLFETAPLLETLKPVTEATGDLIAPLTESVAETTVPLTGSVDQALEPVTDAIPPVLTPVADAVAPIVESVEPVLQPVTEAVAPLTEAVAPVLQPVTGAAGGVLAPTLESLQPVVEPLTGALEPVLQPIVESVHPILSPVIEVTQPILAPIAETVEPITDPIVDVLQPVIDPVQGALPPVLDPILDPVADPEDAINPPITNSDPQVFGPALPHAENALVTLVALVSLPMDATLGGLPLLLVEDGLSPDGAPLEGVPTWEADETFDPQHRVTMTPRTPETEHALTATGSGIEIILPFAPPASPVEQGLISSTSSTSAVNSSGGSNHGPRFDWPSASLPGALLGLFLAGALLLLAVTEASPRTWQFRPYTPPA